jgi:nucleoside-diphosphate-sugar epimerase
MAGWGIETITADLLDRRAIEALPRPRNIVFAAGHKFGATGNPSLTWAMNTLVPALVADTFRESRIVAFSTGNVYPLTPAGCSGASETTLPAPIGEYAQSCVGRERMLEYFSNRYATPGRIVRLNYAIDLRYGVLLDIGRKVFERRAVDLAMSAVNVIWQGDANSVCLRALGVCQSPPLVLNLTGPETLSIRWIAERFGERFGVAPLFSGSEQGSSLLNNSAKCHELFGYPEITAGRLMEWTAEWISAGGATWDKPTHFETRDGKF